MDMVYDKYIPMLNIRVEQLPIPHPPVLNDNGILKVVNEISNSKVIKKPTAHRYDKPLKIHCWFLV